MSKQDPDEHYCCRCNVTLTLLDEHEWPESRSLDFCSSCAIEEIRHLRKKVKNLQQARDKSRG